MPRSKTANQQLHNEQRSKILAAARSVFARNGPAATMDDVAAAANVSHGLAYRYFPSKDALVQSLVDEAIQSSPADPLLDQTRGDPEDRLTLLVTSLIESRRRRPELYLLLNHMRKSASAPKKLTRQMDLRKTAFFDLMKSLILEGQSKGTVRSGDAGQLALAVGAVLEGLTAIALHEPQRFHSSCPEPEIVLRMLIPSGLEKKGKLKP